MRNLWEFGFKLFLGTAPFVMGAAWVHLTAMNHMLMEHDKQIARLMDKTGLRAVYMVDPTSSTVAQQTPPSAP
jgi:hypothetical protein